ALKHKEIRGTGLGLSIVKKCAAAIQADLKVESAPEEGTIMTLTFSNKNIIYNNPTSHQNLSKS
ncbi:MAG: ATP-binding protein, partial [Saprospiraceae bacterium]|nr:ATP-binding protein [Saprospiraceae bacterium]